ncbi:hypothetical protein EIP86_006009 [Pleurotus ostreatoroseus]|nr:hypothetical protein EIP86_006009 [Pleurotus ostreatoroseus]
MAAIRFDSTLGILNIGNTLNSVLYGVATVQVYLYFQRYHHDHLVLKSVVFLMWIANTVGMGLYLDTIYFYNVTNFLNPEALLSPPQDEMIDVYIAFRRLLCHRVRLHVDFIAYIRVLI